MVPRRKETDPLTMLALLGPPTLKSIREEIEIAVWYCTYSKKAKRLKKKKSHCLALITI